MASSWETKNDRPGQVYHGFLGNESKKTPKRKKLTLKMGAWKAFKLFLIKLD